MSDSLINDWVTHHPFISVLILKMLFMMVPTLARFMYLTFFHLGYGLLHSLVFTRLFPTLVTLYVLHHENTDKLYQKGLDFLREMDEERLVKFIKFPK